MAKISNSPTDATILQLEQRKPFTLGLWFTSAAEVPVDLTGSTLRFTAGKVPEMPGQPPTVLFERTAVLAEPEDGFARVDLQAADLDLDPDNYPFAITLVTPGGYSAVVVKGEIRVVFNASVVLDSYTSADPANNLDVVLRSDSVHVDVSHLILAETNVFTSAEKEKLAAIEPGAQVNANADWNATAGDAEILNKPVLGDLALTNVADLMLALHPVGSLWLSVDGTNPTTLFGGSWQRFGQGRALVGVDEADADFMAPEAVFGSKRVTLTAAESGLRNHAHAVSDPGHTHTQDPHTHIQNAHTHTQNAHSHAIEINIQHSDGTVVSGESLTSGLQAGGRRRYRDNTATTTATNQSTTASNQNTTAVNQNAHTGVTVNNVPDADATDAHLNVQPSIAVYIWKRTA